jgi:hypothetical protein
MSEDTEGKLWIQERPPADGEGMTRRGLMYADGQGGFPNDDSQAVSWFQKAAELGHLQGMVNLGVMYAFGRGGLAKSGAQAVEWYARAANGGDGRGMAYLGLMFAFGLGGLRRNDDTAINWYRKADKVGDPRGTALLGLMYEEGRGGLPKWPKDFPQAMELYWTAAQKQDAYAERLLWRGRCRNFLGVTAMFVGGSMLVAFVVDVVGHLTGFWKWNLFESMTTPPLVALLFALIVFILPWAAGRVLYRLLLRSGRQRRWYPRLGEPVTGLISAGLFSLISAAILNLDGLMKVYGIWFLVFVAVEGIWLYRREKLEPIGGKAVTLYHIGLPPVTKQRFLSESALRLWFIWGASLVLWPVACTASLPMSDNLVQSVLVKLVANGMVWRRAHHLPVETAVWQPVSFNSTVLTLAGVVWGIIYAIGVAKSSFRWWLVFVVPIRIYLDIFSDWRALFTALPLNFFLIFGIAHGLAYVVYVWLSYLTGTAPDRVVCENVTYLVFAVLTVVGLCLVDQATA